MQIIQSPNEILRSPAQPVDLSIVKLQKIINGMKKTLIAQKDPEGVGLAANQVGLPYKLFLARFDTKKNSPIHVFVNPEIVSHSKDFQPKDADTDKSQLEGCLSLPKYYGAVKRWKWVELKYQTTRLPDYPPTAIKSGRPVDGRLVDRIDRFEGFPATVIQHEMDHLAGKIFVERIIEQNGKLYKNVGKNSRGKDIWDEVTI